MSVAASASPDVSPATMPMIKALECWGRFGDATLGPAA
jgi:hypothetical protein